MWLNYEERYREAVKDPKFLEWRRGSARHKADNIIAVCDGVRVESLIEIGCGTGAILRELAGRNFARTYAGADVSAAALGAARNEMSGRFIGGFVADAGSLPLAAGTFSVAVLSHVLEHLEAPERAAAEASRVASFVVAEVPTEKVLTNWIRRNFFGRDFSSIEGAGHVQFWSPRSFLEFVREKCDFEILALSRTPVSRKDDLFGKRGVARWKPLVKHALMAILPSFVRIWVFTTHTTVLCRRREAAREKATETLNFNDRSALDSARARHSAA
jgi:SAM-dependent methyltransferase